MNVFMDQCMVGYHYFSMALYTLCNTPWWWYIGSDSREVATQCSAAQSKV